MNIYKRELKSESKSIFYWTSGIGLMLVLSMIAFPMMTDSGVDITNFMDAMPRTLMVLFGMSDLDMGTSLGYHGILFFYVVLAGVIYSAMLGTRIVSKEEVMKTSEFLLTRPRTRKSILTSKVLAGITLITFFNILTYVYSLLSFMIIEEKFSLSGPLFKETVSLYILMLLFFAFGLASAALFRKAKVSGAVTLTAVFITFLISIFHDLLDRPEYLRILTPFRYFPLVDLVEKNELSLLYLMISIILSAILGSLAYILYSKRDMEI